ncbi:MAG: F0F1 ATP synthase subunit A [Nitrospirae bacterium]|nr:F0F1 ATP synthase subunit A [Nitrospirota bacterium]
MDNPLHHFELHTLVPIQIGGLDLSITQGVVMMWLAVAAAFAVLFFPAGRLKTVPGRRQSLAEMAVVFLRDMSVELIGKKGPVFLPLLAALFFFVLFCNLLGLIPGTFTATSQIFVTGALAVTAYFVSVGVGLKYHGLHYFKIFAPTGTPSWLVPLMVPIEVISHLARPLSLALRLFANMTAGHTILAVLFSLTVSLGIALGWLPFGFTVAIYLLEFAVAFIQAYIFTILTTVYIGDAVHLH